MLMRGSFLFLGMSQHPSAAEGVAPGTCTEMELPKWSCLEGPNRDTFWGLFRDTL